MRKDDSINRAIYDFLKENDKKTTAIADKAGIDRAIFSRILHSRRPIYADELLPILNAAGMSLESVIAAIDKDEKGA